jgi:hypothetical protein
MNNLLERTEYVLVGKKFFTHNVHKERIDQDVPIVYFDEGNFFRIKFDKDIHAEFSKYFKTQLRLYELKDVRLEHFLIYEQCATLNDYSQYCFYEVVGAQYKDTPAMTEPSQCTSKNIRQVACQESVIVVKGQNLHVPALVEYNDVKYVLVADEHAFLLDKTVMEENALLFGMKSIDHYTGNCNGANASRL